MENEKRLIDANALITTIQGTASEVARTSPYEPEWFTRLAQRQFEIIGLIDDSPTVDAVEVKHGRWLDTGKPYEDEKCRYNYWECSECNNQIAGRYGLHHYCPNCGAKMDGDGNV